MFNISMCLLYHNIIIRKKLRFITIFIFISIQLQLSQPKDKLTDEEIIPYLTVSIIYHINCSIHYE